MTEVIRQGRSFRHLSDTISLHRIEGGCTIMGNCWIRVRWAIGGFACWAALAGWAMAQYSTAGSNAPVVQNYASALSTTTAQTTAAPQGSTALQIVPAAQTTLQPIPAGQNIAAGQNVPAGQNCNCGPAQAFPAGCSAYGPQRYLRPAARQRWTPIRPRISATTCRCRRGGRSIHGRRNGPATVAAGNADRLRREWAGADRALHQRLQLRLPGRGTHPARLHAG